MEPRIDEIGADFLDTFEIMQTVGVSRQDLLFPENLEKFKEIVEYIKDMPERGYFVKKALRTPGEKPIHKLHEYVQLHKKRGEMEKALATIGSEIELYER
jgi:hypothetical protein